MRGYLSIDPGVNTAYAVWPTEGWRFDSKPAIVGLVKSTPGIDIQDAAREISYRLWDGLKEWEFLKVGIEWPQLFGGSALSYTSAAKGDLFKLTYIIGTIGESARPAPVDLIPVIKWKGQMPKDVCRRRINGILGIKTLDITHHEYDAIGIGLYMQKRF